MDTNERIKVPLTAGGQIFSMRMCDASSSGFMLMYGATGEAVLAAERGGAATQSEAGSGVRLSASGFRLLAPLEILDELIPKVVVAPALALRLQHVFCWIRRSLCHLRHTIRVARL